MKLAFLLQLISWCKTFTSHVIYDLPLDGSNVNVSQ